MMDKIFRRLGFKNDFGWDDPTIVGFIVIWSVFLYGAYIVVLALIDKIL